MYCVGAIENIKLAKEIYPEWLCRFYVDDTVPSDVIDQIRKMGQEIVLVNDKSYGMFWRFLAIDDPNVDVMISRDCDSRLNYREQVAVEEWLKSDKGFHIMHDHPYHKCVPILGGMWGCKRGYVTEIGNKISNWKNYHRKGIDQEFLKQSIWPLIQGKYLRHDSVGANQWGTSLPFPKHMALKFSGSYVGQVFDENNRNVCPALGVI
jgi:hypothetical protein